MTRVDALDATRRSQFSEWVERWVDRGLSTEPADRSSVEAGIQACYRFAGLPPPQTILWAPSPLAAVLEWPRALGEVGPLLPEEFLERIEDLPPEILFGPTLDGELASALGERILSAITDAVSETAGAEAWYGIWSAVNAEIGWTVDEAVSSAVDEALQATTGHHWQGRFGGSWWCAFQAWSSYFREICGLALPRDIWERDAAFAAAQSAGWWWPHRRFVLVCDRPASIERDDQGRLHCPTGPAITWRDGWALWFWHGVRLDGQEALAQTSQRALARAREADGQGFGFGFGSLLARATAS